MKTVKAFLSICVLMAVASGCSTTKSRGNMLSAAGFKMVPADTVLRQGHLRSLPADQITPVQRNGITYYTFPDPKNNVLYVGTEAEYQRYRNLRLQKQMADEQLAAAQMNDMGWGVWGPWAGPGWAWR